MIRKVFRSLAPVSTNRLFQSVGVFPCIPPTNLQIRYLSGPRYLLTTWTLPDAARRAFFLHLQKFSVRWNNWRDYWAGYAPALATKKFWRPAGYGSGMRFRFRMSTMCLYGGFSDYVYSPEVVIP